jgi:4-diphosphocytidyl-2-C-methyl-D-erythritol kinase
VTDGAHRTPIVRLAPAKLNLTLAVVGRRDDGFHDLHSVFVPLALHDVLTVAPAGTAGQDSLHVTGFDPGPPDGNLVLRAVAAARGAVGQGSGSPPTPPLAARLEKRIPVAAGLGGGSSDAAAAFAAALEAWGAESRVDRERWREAAAALGSDVPFFLTASPALVEGRGERVTSLTGVHGHPGILLVTPRVAVRTPDVFAVFDGSRAGAAGDGAVRMTSAHLAQELGNGLSATDLVARAGVLAAANDLLPAAALVAPGLVQVRRALTRLLGRPVGLSGSGPTLWTLYPSLGEAETAAKNVEDGLSSGFVPSIGDGPPTVIATTIRTSHDPATNQGEAT